MTQSQTVPKPVTRVTAIKRFFESGPSGRPVAIKELKELTTRERKELAELAAIELGVELQE
jgi:hypothetical protein